MHTPASAPTSEGPEIQYIDRPNRETSMIGLDVVDIDEGYYHFGREPQRAILGSCVSLILLSRNKLLGGLSCIVGRPSKGPFNYPSQVVEYFKKVSEFYELTDSEYYAVGGSDSCKWVLDRVLDECKKSSIHCSEIDTLGRFHRQVLLSPESGKIQIYKKPRP